MPLRVLFLLLAAMATARVLAQVPPPATALPEASALPQPPADTRLPGINPRECGSSKYAALCAAGRWSLFSSLELHVTAPRFSADYAIEEAANGDIHSTYREEAGGVNRRGGEIVVFSPIAFAYRARESFPDNDSIIDYMLSSPIMLARLTAVLLDEGVLGAPAEVTKRQQIKAASTTRYIRTPAPRTAALYAPPWSMTGSVRPAGPGQVAFTMQLNYRPVDSRGLAVAGKTDRISLQGVASYAPKRPALPESLDLTGWKLLRDAEPLPGVATLGAARKAAVP